jgi:hypothetical protein
MKTNEFVSLLVFGFILSCVHAYTLYKVHLLTLEVGNLTMENYLINESEAEQDSVKNPGGVTQ